MLIFLISLFVKRKSRTNLSGRKFNLNDYKDFEYRSSYKYWSSSYSQHQAENLD